MSLLGVAWIDGKGWVVTVKRSKLAAIGMFTVGLWLAAPSPAWATFINYDYACGSDAAGTGCGTFQIDNSSSNLDARGATDPNSGYGIALNYTELLRTNSTHTSATVLTRGNGVYSVVNQVVYSGQYNAAGTGCQYYFAEVHWTTTPSGPWYYDSNDHRLCYT